MPDLTTYKIVCVSCLSHACLSDLQWFLQAERYESRLKTSGDLPSYLPRAFVIDYMLLLFFYFSPQDSWPLYLSSCYCVSFLWASSRWRMISEAYPGGKNGLANSFRWGYSWKNFLFADTVSILSVFRYWNFPRGDTRLLFLNVRHPIWAPPLHARIASKRFEAGCKFEKGGLASKSALAVLTSTYFLMSSSAFSLRSKRFLLWDWTTFLSRYSKRFRKKEGTSFTVKSGYWNIDSLSSLCTRRWLPLSSKKLLRMGLGETAARICWSRFD